MYAFMYVGMYEYLLALLTFLLHMTYLCVYFAGTDPIDKICADVMKRREVKSRWIKTEILVIDEISMLSAEMFDILSFVGTFRTLMLCVC